MRLKEINLLASIFSVGERWHKMSNKYNRKLADHNSDFFKRFFSNLSFSSSKPTRMSTSSLHLMILPAVILLLIYRYLPMIGLVMAFEDFEIYKGFSAFWESEWVGLDNFRRVLSLPGSIQAIKNTLIISFMKMITMFFIPIITAILLNEIRKQIIKRSVQTLIYLPHFLSWVILAGILKTILASNGLVNNFLKELLNIRPIFFLGKAGIFRHILVWSNVWKEFGFSTIVYLAAITGINPNLYEAAIVDGANRWRQIWHITIPGMKRVIVLLAVLSLGGILNAGFEQVFNLYSVPVYKTGDIISTFVYRISFESGQYKLGAAVGLFKSVVSFSLVSISYWLAVKFANYEIF